jgi:dUTP pyrophosphatase
MEIKLKKLKPNIKLPSYAHAGDAGLDLYSNETFEIMPGERHEFALGFALEIPIGYVGLVWDKGGLSFKHGIHCLGGVGDAGYRGEYIICLINLGEISYKIEKGDKIAQLLIQPIKRVEIEVVKNLDETSRGDGAFGSTGKK